MKMNLQSTDALMRSMRFYIVADICIASIICICGGGLLASGLLNTEYFFITAGIIVLLAGIFSIVQTLRFFVQEELLAYRIVTLDNARVVWLYYSKLSLMPFGVGLFNRCKMYVCTIDGKIFTLRAGEQQIKNCIAEATTENTAITSGYSVDREQLFKADPRLLRKD